MSFTVDQDTARLAPSGTDRQQPRETDLDHLAVPAQHPVASERPGFTNLGYWGDGAVTAREAQLTLVRRLADRLGDLGGMRVLDASYAAGGSAAVLALEYGAQVDAINVPAVVADGALAYAAAHDAADRLRFHSAGPTALPFRPGSFDVVFSVETAHRLADKSAFVLEAYRALRPGGVLALSDMTATVDLPLARRLRSHGVDLLTAQAWQTMVRNAGFEILEHRLVGSAVYPGHRRWMMLTAAERRRAISASLTPSRALLAPIKQAQAWWLEFFGHRSGMTFAGALGLREYVLMLGRRPHS